MIDQKTLDDIIQRVVDAVQPEKIILFGSAARDGLHVANDVDLLVIRDGENTLELMRSIYRNLQGVGAAVDAVVVSSQDVERFGDSHALVIKPALREGRVVYDCDRSLTT